MMPPSTSATAATDTLLLFADISGYTRFIRDNPYSLAHATWIVHQLIEAVTEALAPHLRLAKLEGDAAFCIGTPDAPVGAAVLDAFAAFQARKAHLDGTNACPCDACRAISDLDLKILVHRGEVVRFQAATGEEVSGLPVIVLHRLGKNGVKAPRYLLWTAEAEAAVGPLDGIVHKRVERYPDVGAVPVSVFADLPGPAPVVRAGRLRLALDHLLKGWLWLPLRLRLPRRPA